MSIASTSDVNFMTFDRPDHVEVTAQGLFIAGEKLCVSAPVPGVLRLQIGDFSSPDSGPDYGILSAIDAEGEDAARNLQPDIRSDGTLIFLQEDLALHIYQNPVRLKLWRQGTCILTSILDEHFRGWSRLPALAKRSDAWTFAFELQAEEPVYGLGEKFGRLNKRGELVHSYVEDALGVSTELSYKNTPFCWSPLGWGIFLHTPATVTHGVGYGAWSHRAYAAIVDEPRLDISLMAAETPAEILGIYTNLTGKAPEVPLWSYGIWVSRAYYQTGDDIQQAAKELRARDFPADVITFDGRAWLETSTRFNFKWDEKRYPNPKKTMQALKDLDFHICNWEYPLVSVEDTDYAAMAEKGWFLKNAQGDTYVYHWDTDAKTSPFGTVLTPLPPSALLDFTHPEAYAYWRDSHIPLFQSGVDVMKVDFGEQVPFDAVSYNGDTGRRLHSVYSLLYNRCVFEASQSYFGAHACVWARAGWAGSHRYPVQWGGDPQSDWGGLSGSIRGGLSWGMSGAPYHATDVGGFYGATQPDASLYLRWVQFSIFSSHFRIHGIGAREPWCFGERAEYIARQWFKLRYRLIPYLKAAGDRARITSLPVMQAMALAFPQDRIAQGFEHQFMCGESLLIIPVIQEDQKVTFWLPAQESWIDIWTGQAYAGGQMLTWHVMEDNLPVFLCAGHALPLGPIVSSTKELPESGVISEVIAPTDVTYVADVFGDQLEIRDGRVFHMGGDVVALQTVLTLPDGQAE